MFDLRSIKVIVLGALAMLLAFTMPSFSSATFTSSSTSTTSITSGTWDRTSPEVEVKVPGQISGTSVITASAHDNVGGSGIKSVTFQVRAANGKWESKHTDTTAPYQWSWNTTTNPTAYYDIRAVAVDNATNATTSAAVRTLVLNGRAVVLTPPAEVVRGFVQLTSTVYNNSFSFVWWQNIQYRPLGDTGEFRPLRSSSWYDNPFRWTWNTTQLDDGDYELRSERASLLFGSIYSAPVTVTIDNDPSTQGTSAFAEPSPTAMVVTQKPVDEAATPAITPDSASQPGPAPRPVEPTVQDEPENGISVEPAPDEPPAVSGDDDDQPVPGEDDDQTAPGDDEDETAHGEDEDETVPGDEDAMVEEAELRGVSISVADGGNGAGSLSEGDKFTFTYSGEIDPTTVLAGWSGEATAVSVRLRDGQLLGGGAQDDTLDIRSGEMPVELGQVHLGADVIDNDQQILLPATVVAQTVTVDGALLSTVTVTLGAVVDEAEVLRPTTTAPALTWTPSAAVTTTTGRPCMTEAVTQFAGETF